MTANPYLPPRAPVSDVAEYEALATRPWQVGMVIKIAVVAFIVSAVMAALNWNYLTSKAWTPILVAVQLFQLVVTVWIYYKIYAGRNWARILYLVCSLLVIVAYLDPVKRAAFSIRPMTIQISTLLNILCLIANVWLLFLSPGREWFKKMRAVA